MKRLGMVLAISLCMITACQGDKMNFKLKNEKNPVVKMTTSQGDLYIELYKKEAPISVDNFLTYVEDGFYDNTIFHRVINGFVIQGGGFAPGLQQKQTREPIKNEASNGLPNLRGTLSMARTNVVDSATSQFFINLVDNANLDHRGEHPMAYGYAVFGTVVSGMDVVDAIKSVETTTVGYYQDVPKEDVLILHAEIVKK